MVAAAPRVFDNMSEWNRCLSLLFVFVLVFVFVFVFVVVFVFVLVLVYVFVFVLVYRVTQKKCNIRILGSNLF